MSTPRPDQIRRQSAIIAELGQRLAKHPDALVDLCATIEDLIGGGSSGNGRGSKGSVADPTGAVALTDDAMRKDLRSVTGSMDRMVREANVLLTHLRIYTPTPVEVRSRKRAVRSLDAIPACRAHQRAGVFATAGDRYRDLCRWCGDFRADRGMDPSPKLIRHYDSGQRLTEQTIARLMPKAARIA